MLILAQRDMLQLYKIKSLVMTAYNILLVFWDYIIRNVIIVDNKKGFLIWEQTIQTKKKWIDYVWKFNVVNEKQRLYIYSFKKDAIFYKCVYFVLCLFAYKRVIKKW